MFQQSEAYTDVYFYNAVNISAALDLCSSVFTHYQKETEL